MSVAAAAGLTSCCARINEPRSSPVCHMKNSPIRLTPPQLEFLEKLCQGPATAVETYAPVKKLVALEFARGKQGRYGSWTFTITEAGRVYYEAIKRHPGR